MAYRVNGVECDTPEEVLKLLEVSRSAKVSAEVRVVHAVDIDRRSAAGILADENKARRQRSAMGQTVVPRGSGHHSECGCGHCPTEERPAIGEPGGPCCGKGGDCNCDRRS